MMKYLFYIAILLCVAFGCKPKKSSEIAKEKTIDSTELKTSVETMVSKEQQPYFIATGTEPFWSVEIFENLIVYKTPTDSIKTPHTEPIRAVDANVKRYNIQTESKTLHIQIQEKECTNGMSGKVSPYSVSVEIKKNIDAEFQKLEGCGNYNTDYRLHDIWLLEILNGKKASLEDFKNELPNMEINAAENTFTGFAGCNRMNGQLFFEKGLLRLTNVATTRMMCEPNNKEAEFLKALQSSTTYSIENKRLTLSNPSGTQTIFKKID
ncbi:MAG: META domain-containing protein [Aquaticitalea sp.]